MQYPLPPGTPIFSSAQFNCVQFIFLAQFLHNSGLRMRMIVICITTVIHTPLTHHPHILARFLLRDALLRALRV